MRFLTFVAIFLFVTNVFACGNKAYELQTEVEINGKVVRPRLTVHESETAVVKTKDGQIETGVQVIATEVWDETYQGNAVKLEFKIFQNNDRLSLGDQNLSLIALYNQASEKTVRGENVDSKPVRVKVIAKKL